MRGRTLLVLILLALYPGTAHAWWWDYFDGLSGPGPFKADHGAPSFEVTFWPDVVVRKQGLHQALLDDPSRQKTWYVAFRTVGLNNDDHLQMFENQPLDRRHVDLTTFDLSAMYRVNRVLDLGVGASILRFSGEGFETFTRVGPIGKMTVTPFGGFIPARPRAFWLLRVPKFYADVTIVRGFEAADFGNPNGDLSTSVETKVRAGLLFDVSAIVCAFKGCATR
jgi:hypothetical protein